MTKIEWTDATWNPIVGCSIVSPGCTNCYAMKIAARLQAMAEADLRKRGIPPGAVFDATGTPLAHYLDTTQPSKGGPVWTGRLNLAPEHILTEPLRRKKPTMYFVNSMSDLFHEDVPDDWIDKVFAVMALCPQHTFQVLTKRSARMRAYLKHRWEDMDKDEPNTMWEDCAYWRVSKAAESIDQHRYDRSNVGGCHWWPLPNVWLGVSAERQQEADARIPDLLATPAAVRFVSAEPLLGPIDFEAVRYTHAPGFFGSALRWHHRGHCHKQEGLIYPRLDWIIAGGESGPDARPMHPEWARAIRDQCQDAGVSFFFKQWGAFRYHGQTAPDGTIVQAPLVNGGMIKSTKASSGRLLDGRMWDEMPGWRTGDRVTSDERQK